MFYQNFDIVVPKYKTSHLWKLYLSYTLPWVLEISYLPLQYVDTSVHSTVMPALRAAVHTLLTLLATTVLAKHRALIQLTALYCDSCICVTGMRNVDDLVSMCAACRERVNPYLFNYALSVALLHRPDTRNLRIPPLFESFPDKFVDGAIFNKARQESEIFLSGSRVCSYGLQRAWMTLAAHFWLVIRETGHRTHVCPYACVGLPTHLHPPES
jgi:hypothetical protein